MATEWFENRGTGVLQHEEEPSLLLVGDGVPDWVRIPEPLPDAGKKLKVLGHDVGTCVQCKTRVIRLLQLEDKYWVGECVPGGCGFVWYREKE